MADVLRYLRPHRDNPEARMSVLDHLRELRRRLILVVLIVVAGGVLGWFFYPPILDFLKAPYCDVSPEYRFSPTTGTSCSLIYHGVLDGFTARLKISVVAGAVVTGPLWLYQIWGFITPGLRRNERRYTFWFILTSTLLFIAGMALAYVALAKGMNVMLRMSGAGTQALLTVNAYIGFVTLMLIAFGAAFELPLLVVMANLVGVLPARLLKKSQRIGIFLIFAFAAVATPSTGPFIMIAMALPMVALFEAAVLIAVVHDRRKAQRRLAAQSEPTLDDDTASTIEAIPERLVTKPSGPEGWSDIT